MGLTNISISKANGILAAFGKSEDIEKAHVKSYTKTTKSGKMVQVKEHDDKRKKKEPVISKESVNELTLYIDNDRNIYDRAVSPTEKSLLKKVKKGTYDSEKALKAFQHVADYGSKMYSKENKENKHLFTVAERKEVAKNLLSYFETENKVKEK